MTRAGIAPIAPLIGPVIRERIKELRERAGISREELAERAREYGLDEKFTATVVGFLERGRRGLTVEELLAIAQALEVSPLELLGDQAAVFVGEGDVAPLKCPTCDSDPSSMERTVRTDLAQLDELAPLEATLVATAVRLAGAIDAAVGDKADALPRLARELRATLAQIAAGRADGGDDDDELDGLDDPV